MSEESGRSIERDAAVWSLGLSVLMIVAGVLAIAAPLVAGIAINLVLAWMLIFSGVAHLAFAWHARTTGGSLWELLMGVLYAGIGVYLLLHPVTGLTALTLALAIYLFAEGVLELVLSFVVRPLPGSSWLLFDGIVTVILGILIWTAWPSSAEWAIGTIVGISMLFSGITRLMISLARHHHAQAGSGSGQVGRAAL